MKEQTQAEITKKGNPRKPQGDAGRLMLCRMNQSHAPMTDWALGFADFQQDDAVLDIGCGGGAALRRLSEKMAHGVLYGVDYSDVSVALAKENNAEDIKSGKMHILEASVESLPFADAAFDKIITVESFYFWPSPAENLREVLRVLKPNGVFLLIAEIYRKNGLSKETLQTVEQYQLCNPTTDEFETMFRNAGFAEVRIHKKDGTDWICVQGVK